MAKKLKIVHIASEVSPYSKTGGLADVARSLPKALNRLDHEVIIITPLYGKVINRKKYKIEKIIGPVKVALNSTESVEVNYYKTYLMEDLPVYFIENKKYFSKHHGLYGSGKENARFLVFDVAALKLLSLLKFQADIIHCHDWQTGLIPHYLKNDFRYSKTLKKAKVVYTIHNLVFQFGHNWWDVPISQRDYGRKKIPHLSDSDLENINFAKRAIISADIINTVSEQYREEIMTRKFGQDLHRILKNRQDRLFGIINGIDYYSYNPLEDKSLFSRYDFFSPEIKLENKKILQKQLRFSVDLDVPFLCATSRVTFQKGYDLIIQILPQLLRHDIQILFLGDGDKSYISSIKKLVKKYPKKIIWLPFKDNEHLETMAYAASDFFILPSHHEPCGINQLIAMRYGSIPIVREVGGLYDTVSNFNPQTGHGTGFTFRGEDQLSFYGAIVRALENYKFKGLFNKLLVRAMKQSSSWEIPAKKYLKLYRKALKD
jgi:starch synthase